MTRPIFAILDSRYGRGRGPSRRETLKAAAITSAALLLSNVRRARADDGKRVVVVGAGLAGLACAYELSTVGYQVTVIEARRRLGGRVQSIGDLAREKSVEAGGEFFGINHAVFRAYAAKFKLASAEGGEDEGESPVFLGGKRLTTEEAQALHAEMDAATATLNEDAAAVPEDEPWKTPGARALDHRTVAQWIEKASPSPRCAAALTAQITADFGVSPDRVSLLALLVRIKGGGLEKYWTDSHTDRLAGGNQQLAERLASAIGVDRVITGVPVESIDIAPHGVNVVTRSRRFDADDLVLATPPATWSKIRVTPALPPELTIQSGRQVKMLALVNDRFWAREKLAAESLSDGPLGLTWESTDGQDAPGGFVLAAQAGGPAVDACRKAWAAQKSGFLRAELAKVFGDAPAPVDARMIDWAADPLTLGGSSCAAPGQVTRAGPLMAKPVSDHLHLAGEHTCLKFAGTMEGALRSGVRVARRLAERDGLALPGPTTAPSEEPDKAKSP